MSPCRGPARAERAWLAALASCAPFALAAPAGAAPVEGPPDPTLEEPDEAARPDLREPVDELMAYALEGALPEGFSEPEAFLALLSNESGRHIRAREQAEAILAKNPDSVAGHVVLGLALHRGEGNLGLARYQYRKALRLFQEQHGVPTEDTPWSWQLIAYNGLADVNGDMGRDEEKLEVLEERDRYYGYQPVHRAWSLMRLGRYEEAVDAAERTLLRAEEPAVLGDARTSLCGIAGELLERAQARERCLEAVELAARSGMSNPVYFSNAAEAALGVLAFDAAERLYLDATRVPTYGTPANPWMELTRMYVAQGRSGEARDAMRRMFAWRASQPAIIDAQTRSAIDLTSAGFLLAAGRPRQAARIAARGVDRPDRQGSISFSPGARAAGAALMDRVANLTAAEQRWEEVSWLPWNEAWRARVAALEHSLRAWWSGRRARGLLADERTLLHSVIPYASGSVVIPEWLQPELVEVVGAGPVAAVLEQAPLVEPVLGDEGYLFALQAEVAHQRGRPEEAVLLAQRALAVLPRAEVLLRARVAARGGQDAMATGQRSVALDLFDRALQGDPGVMRRLGIALPCVFDVETGGMADRAGELLAGSPRLREAGFGFRVRTSSEGDVVESCLVGPSGSLHACARVAPEPGETEEAQVRRLAAEFHTAVLAPRVDLTQADLDSLDGSTTVVGIRGTERARELLAEWGVGESEAQDEP